MALWYLPLSTAHNIKTSHIVFEKHLARGPAEEVQTCERRRPPTWTTGAKEITDIIVGANNKAKRNLQVNKDVSWELASDLKVKG